METVCKDKLNHVIRKTFNGNGCILFVITHNF